MTDHAAGNIVAIHGSGTTIDRATALSEQVKQVCYAAAGDGISLAVVLGVLTIVGHELIQECQK
jgi:DNA-binding protein